METTKIIKKVLNNKNLLFYTSLFLCIFFTFQVLNMFLVGLTSVVIVTKLAISIFLISLVFLSLGKTFKKYSLLGFDLSITSIVCILLIAVDIVISLYAFSCSGLLCDLEGIIFVSFSIPIIIFIFAFKVMHKFFSFLKNGDNKKILYFIIFELIFIGIGVFGLLKNNSLNSVIIENNNEKDINKAIQVCNSFKNNGYKAYCLQEYFGKNNSPTKRNEVYNICNSINDSNSRVFCFQEYIKNSQLKQ